MTAARGWGLALGWLADQALGDPARFHPVAGFGKLAAAFEARGYADDRARGAGHVVALVGGVAGLGWLLQRAARGKGWATTAVTAVATWAVLGGRSLAREAGEIAVCLRDGDISDARAGISRLVSRDPEPLDADGIARAALESVAENTSDAVVAPLLWGAAFGVPGLLAYRAVNTLDAMVGYRNSRYLRFGWASARLDDLVNWLPARVTGGLAALAAPVVGGRPSEAARAVSQQAGRHPSPNGGVAEAAFAGALGVRLGGTNVYAGEPEDRGELGFGPAPAPADLERGVQLAQVVSAAAALLAVVIAWRRR